MTNFYLIEFPRFARNDTVFSLKGECWGKWWRSHHFPQHSPQTFNSGRHSELCEESKFYAKTSILNSGSFLVSLGMTNIYLIEIPRFARNDTVFSLKGECWGKWWRSHSFPQHSPPKPPTLAVIPSIARNLIFILRQVF